MRARRTDANHAVLIRALGQCGWRVKDTHMVPGFVDAVVMRAGVVRLVEFKAPRGRLTPSQADMQGDGWNVAILRSIDDCVQLR
jgi:hypothetical protein